MINLNMRLMMFSFVCLIGFTLQGNVYNAVYAQAPIDIIHSANESEKTIAEEQPATSQDSISHSKLSFSQKRPHLTNNKSPLRDSTAKCEESTLNAKLKGIYIGNRERDSYARIRMNHSTHTYQIGHQLSDRTIVGIQWGRVSPRVILQINGQQECLSLQTSHDAYISSLFQKKQDTSLRSKTVSNNVIVKELEPNHFLIDRSQLPSLEYEDLLRQARIIPNYKAGQQIGLRVFGVRPNALLYKLGIRSGDIFVSINQIKLSTLNKLLEAYDDIVAKVNQPVSAQLIRKGKIRNFKWISQ